MKVTADPHKTDRPEAVSQTVQWATANMATDIYAARAMIAHAARLKDQGIQANMHASMAKLFASDAAVRHTGIAIEVCGIQGYAQGHVLERLYRDAKVTQIYEGTNEVQRIIIARTLQHKGLLP